MVAISILPQVQFGPNDHREGAPHFSTHLSDRKYDLDIELAKTESRLVLKENGINELNRTIIQLKGGNLANMFAKNDLANTIFRWRTHFQFAKIFGIMANMESFSRTLYYIWRNAGKTSRSYYLFGELIKKLRKTMFL